MSRNPLYWDISGQSIYLVAGLGSGRFSKSNFSIKVVSNIKLTPFDICILNCMYSCIRDCRTEITIREVFAAIKQKDFIPDKININHKSKSQPLHLFEDDYDDINSFEYIKSANKLLSEEELDFLNIIHGSIHRIWRTRVDVTEQLPDKSIIHRNVRLLPISYKDVAHTNPASQNTIYFFDYKSFFWKLFNQSKFFYCVEQHPVFYLDDDDLMN